MDVGRRLEIAVWNAKNACKIFNDRNEDQVSLKQVSIRCMTLDGTEYEMSVKVDER